VVISVQNVENNVMATLHQGSFHTKWNREYGLYALGCSMWWYMDGCLSADFVHVLKEGILRVQKSTRYKAWTFQRN